MFPEEVNARTANKVTFEIRGIYHNTPETHAPEGYSSLFFVYLSVICRSVGKLSICRSVGNLSICQSDNIGFQ